MPSSEGELHSTEQAIPNNGTSVPIAQPKSNSVAREVEINEDLEPVTTTFSSRGRPKKASRKLLENSSNTRLKYALGFLGTITTYTLNAPHFVYAECKRNHVNRRVLFHAKTLHHLEVINMNADSTYNYIHPLVSILPCTSYEVFTSYDVVFFDS